MLKFVKVTENEIFPSVLGIFLIVHDYEIP